MNSERTGLEDDIQKAGLERQGPPTLPEGSYSNGRLQGLPASVDYPSLYAWQQEAIDAWRHNGRRGVVEAVTGAGKTRVGIAAASDALRKGFKVLVLVPTTELQNQWAQTLKQSLPRVKRGTLGNGRQDSLATVDVLVAIVHSPRLRTRWDTTGHSISITGPSCSWGRELQRGSIAAPSPAPAARSRQPVSASNAPAASRSWPVGTPNTH